MTGMVTTTTTMATTARRGPREAAARRSGGGARRTTLGGGFGGGCLAALAVCCSSAAMTAVPFARAEVTAAAASAGGHDDDESLRPEAQLGTFTLAETETRSVEGGGGDGDGAEERRLALAREEDEDDGRSLALREWYVQVIDDSYNMTYGEDEKSIEFQFEMSTLGTERNFTVGLYDYDCVNELNYTEFFVGGEGGIVNTVETGYETVGTNVRDRLTTKVNLVSTIQFTDLFVVAEDKASASITVCVRVDQGLGDPTSSDFTRVAYRKINSVLTLVAGTVTFQSGVIGQAERKFVTSEESSALIPLMAGSRVSLYIAAENVYKFEFNFFRKTGDALPVVNFLDESCDPNERLKFIDNISVLGEPNVTVAADGLEFVLVTYLIDVQGNKKNIGFCTDIETGTSALILDARRNLQQSLAPPPGQAADLVAAAHQDQAQQQRERELAEAQCGGTVSIVAPMDINTNSTTNATTLVVNNITYWCTGDTVLISSDFDIDYEIEVCQCVSDTDRTCATGPPTIRQNVPLRLCLNIPSTDVEFAFISSLTITGDEDNVFKAVEDGVAAIPYLAEVELQNPARKAHIDVIVPMSLFFGASGKVTVEGYADLKFYDGSPDRRALLKTGDGSSAGRNNNGGGAAAPPRMLQNKKPKDNFQFDVALQPLDRGEDDVYPGGEEKKVLMDEQWEDISTLHNSGTAGELGLLALLPPALFAAGILLLL